MAEKKDPCRFTVMFDRTDPGHLRVAGILNQQRHRKAQFIVNAVLHYMSCPETPAIPAPLPVESPSAPESRPMDKQAILEIVIQYLEERERNKAGVQLPESHPDRPAHRLPDKKALIPSEKISLDDAESLLGEDGLAAIAQTMSDFFGK